MLLVARLALVGATIGLYWIVASVSVAVCFFVGVGVQGYSILKLGVGVQDRTWCSRLLGVLKLLMV